MLCDASRRHKKQNALLVMACKAANIKARYCYYPHCCLLHCMLMLCSCHPSACVWHRLTRWAQI